MPLIKNKNTLNIILLFNIFVLTAAFFIQYVLGYQPCNLCLLERIPYICAILIIFFCLFFNKFEKILLVSLSLIFLLATILSFYHVGIEQGLIKESFACDLKADEKILTAEELLKTLKEKKISCKDVTFQIMGISLATINAIISLVLSVINFKIYLNYEKN